MPYYEFKGHRQVLLDYFNAREIADQKDPSAYSAKGLKAYWKEKNSRSIDGITGLVQAPHAPYAPVCTDVMKNANATEGGEVVANGDILPLKSRVDRRRLQEWVVAFVMGGVVAAVYVRVADVV